MSQSLRSMTDEERKKAIRRRLTSGEKGLGYWAAVDAERKENTKKSQPAPKENE